MNNSYIIEKPSILEALDDIQNFEIMMNKFINKYPNYSYEIDIKETEGPLWTVELNVRSDEPENNTNT